MSTAQAALIGAVARLRAAGVEDPARDARLLLAHALGLDPARLSLVIRDPLGPDAAQRFEAAIAARALRKPVSKITGTRLFHGLSFRVTPEVLDPRPETETLVEEALREPFARILDLGTGSGCILLSCLHGMPGAMGLGADYSGAALGLADENAVALGLSERVDFCRCDWTDGDWWDGGRGYFDLVVSNPPYIAADEMAGLAPEVLDWDPQIALTPGGDGLDAYRAICRELPRMLAPGGRILFEIGPTQGAAVSALLAEQGIRDIRILPDLDTRDRVVAGRRPA
ncbi:peptide chain release factor N(5)-glutamine methyltransferase [Pseudogemmobacter humi]|uniref:Release factor glutamine methyltransferase n=1 Tax=Pseudogemmobacter humi TaxID=2483812 RepID=A0A3P5X723_9RHOB|nr:peptide chain release factor N(5)-glutamine methyltransferase [Pseudogemmobacter humi]VDC30154.1 Release factor glutamine methyltransferase [Pseudogemmobacter humi]